MTVGLSAADERELAALRRRAYGPDADLDEEGERRLRALEGRDTLPPVVADDISGPSNGHGKDGHGEDDPVEDPPRPQEPIGATLRRRRVIVTLVGILVMAAMAAAVWFLTREGGTVLRRVAVNDTAAQQQLSGSLRNFGIDPDSYVQFESFEGFSVWTARIPDRGVRCVLVVDEAAASTTYNGLTAYNCTPEGMTPVADVVQYGDRGITDLGDRPVGSVARFTFLGDRVEVDVAEAREEPLIGTPAPR